MFMSVTMVKCTRKMRTEIGNTTKTAIGTVLKANRKQTQPPRANRKTQHVNRTLQCRTVLPRNKIGLRKQPILLRVALLATVWIRWTKLRMLARRVIAKPVKSVNSNGVVVGDSIAKAVGVPEDLNQVAAGVVAK
jgi:hypothetical protein